MIRLSIAALLLIAIGCGQDPAKVQERKQIEWTRVTSDTLESVEGKQSALLKNQEQMIGLLEKIAAKEEEQVEVFDLPEFSEWTESESTEDLPISDPELPEVEQPSTIDVADLIDDDDSTEAILANLAAIKKQLELLIEGTPEPVKLRPIPDNPNPPVNSLQPSEFRVVKYTATWCRACTVWPDEKLICGKPDKVDVDQNKTLVQQLDINAFPSFDLMLGTRLIKRWISIEGQPAVTPEVINAEILKQCGQTSLLTSPVESGMSFGPYLMRF